MPCLKLLPLDWTGPPPDGCATVEGCCLVNGLYMRQGASCEVIMIKRYFSTNSALEWRPKMLHVFRVPTRRKALRVLFAASSVFLMLAASVSAVFADAVAWNGNGINAGLCGSITRDPSLPAGLQAWLFIMTSPDARGPYNLTVTFNSGGTMFVTGAQAGGGSIHFKVMTPVDARVVSASATGSAT